MRKGYDSGGMATTATNATPRFSTESLSGRGNDTMVKRGAGGGIASTLHGRDLA